MLTLFASKGTVALASHIALEETGLPYQMDWRVMRDGDLGKPEYLEINPKGRVPALLTDDGILTETPAILDYIVDLTGQLMPQDPFKRGRVREMVAFLAATMHVNHAHKMRAYRWSDDADAQTTMVAKVTQNMADNCAYIEALLPDTGWLVGSYSIADIHLHSVSRWLAGDNVDIANYPKLAAHFDAMLARPAVAKVTQAHS